MNDVLDKTVFLETPTGVADETYDQLFKLERRFIKMVCKELNINRKQFKKLYKSKKQKDAGFKEEIDRQFAALKASYSAQE